MKPQFGNCKDCAALRGEFCRRHPPQLSNMSAAFHPHVEEMNGCWDFIPKEAKIEATDAVRSKQEEDALGGIWWRDTR